MTREEAIENIKLLIWTDNYPKDFADALRMAIEALSVELVRCKDCKHKRTCAKTVNMSKSEPNSITSWVQPLDFCSYGERSI